MHIAYEFVYSHITWFLEVLLVLFMGTAAISVYQLNNYNHTVAEVLSRYGGLTPQAANNLEHEHNARYGNMFNVTTRDGKQTGPTVPYGDEITYTIHPKIPFFNTYINAGVDEHVASEVRQVQSMSGRTLNYDNQTPLYKEVKQQAALTSNDNSKDQTTQSLVQAGFFMDNLGEQDAVALVGCTSDSQINVQSLIATVQKGDLSTLPASSRAKLQQNQLTLSIAECVTLHKALASALQSKMPFDAIFVIKHADSTTKMPDYDVVATTFVPPDSIGGVTFILNGDLDSNKGGLRHTLSAYTAYHNRARWSDVVQTDAVNCTDYLWIGQVMYYHEKPSIFYSDHGYFGQLYENHDQESIDKFVSDFENIAKKNGQTWHGRDSICTEGHNMIDQLSGRNGVKESYILGRYQKDGKTMYYLFGANVLDDKHEIASPKIFDSKVKAAIDKYNNK